MFNYYDDKLAASKLKQVYEIATLRVKQYLEAEMVHIFKHIRWGDSVLELGCGYGRVLGQLAAKAKCVVGIDTSMSSLQLAREELQNLSNIGLAQMDAARLGFSDRAFDVVVCIQNGISAFHVDQRKLVEEAMRVTEMGGIALFSSYSHKFWEDRLAWFRLQSEAALLGEIDYEKTRDGVIVCKDGFTANTIRSSEFVKLCEGLDVQVDIVEVDESSLFCEIRRR